MEPDDSDLNFVPQKNKIFVVPENVENVRNDSNLSLKQLGKKK